MGQLPLSMVTSHELPWYSYGYLYSLQQRFEMFSDVSRQDLFKALYENIDRESPVYEEEFDAALEIAGNMLDVYASDQRLLDYLFKELPADLSDSIRDSINATAEDWWTGHLVLWSFESQILELYSLWAWFSDPVNSYKLRFSSKEAHAKIEKSIKKSPFLLVLSIVKRSNEDIYELHTELLQFPSSSNKQWAILKKSLNFDEFIQVFNNSDLTI